jgi:hypothetical protein
LSFSLFYIISTQGSYIHQKLDTNSCFSKLRAISNLFSFFYTPCSLKLFKIDPVVSVLPATNRQYFILALSLPLHWLRVTFVLNTLISLKDLDNAVFQASDIAKRLRINVLVISYRDISRTEDFRKRYLYFLKVVDKICCLRPTRIRLHNLK